MGSDWWRLGYCAIGSVFFLLTVLLTGGGSLTAIFKGSDNLRAPSCVQRLGKAGGLPGLWNSHHSYWAPLDPECASRWDEVAESGNESDYLAGRSLFFLGDSILRDIAISLEETYLRPQNTTVATDSDLVDARMRAKKKCTKDNLGRTDSCRMRYGSGAVGRFVWFQWLSTPHRIPWGLAPARGNPYQQQELDLCCIFSHGAGFEGTNISSTRDTGLQSCLAALFHSATARDILVLRTGLNYPLYAPHVAYESVSLAPGEWPTALEADLTSFLWTVLPGAFPGAIVYWQLDQAISAEGLLDSCREGPNTRVASMIPAARAIQARVIQEAIIKSPLSGRLLTIDPSNMVATEDDMKALYVDCLHSSVALDRIKGVALMVALRSANLPA